MSSYTEQLPDGLIAQWSNAPRWQRSWVQMPFRPEVVFRLYSHDCLSCVHNWNDKSCLHDSDFDQLEPNDLARTNIYNRSCAYCTN